MLAAKKAAAKKAAAAVAAVDANAASAQSGQQDAADDGKPKRRKMTPELIAKTATHQKVKGEVRLLSGCRTLFAAALSTACPQKECRL